MHQDSCYSFGWSHGKEKLQGRPDVSKGSYYANPQYDRYSDLSSPRPNPTFRESFGYVFCYDFKHIFMVKEYTVEI